MNILTAFAAFLRDNKERVVRSKEVLVERWDPTYGQQDPGTETIEYVDFDALCEAMDEFAATFKDA